MVVIIFMLLCSIKISTTYASKECSPSRCGNQEIGYPFTLKGDTSDCTGDEKYQLSCIGNKTFMAAPYDNYLVTNIFYHGYSIIINIVDTDLATGKCSLPSQAITPSFFPDGFYFVYDLDMRRWAGFINCSEKLDSNFSGAAIPCLSQNNRFIYLVVDRFGVKVDSLAKSCTYLTMVPTMLSDTELYNIGDNISGIMKNIEFTLLMKTNSSISYSHLLDLLILIGHLFLYLIFLYLGIITLGRLVMAPLCILVFLLYELFKMLSPIDNVEIFLRNQQRTTVTRYVYTDIVAMTRHFKDRLGQGGFGTVYRGELPGDYLVAVKLLDTSNDNGEDFISEVSTIGTIHHNNVVRLIGFCSEGLHRALVYEYMNNGSLDKYIFSTTQKFTSKKLTEIALGVARGIDYLHRGCDMRILHFDIKPHNILLDSNFNPKVSDFGLAKLYSKDNSLVSTFAARGTIGYMAPELISRSFGLISYKSDVYSFGMLLLEMAGGRRNYDSRVENSSEAYYPSWIYDRLNKQTNLEVLNHNVETVDVEKKLCKVGLWCIQMSPSTRPTMLRVIEMLEGDVEDVEMPPKPFFFTTSDNTTTEQNSYRMSSNEISTIYESE